MDRQDELVCSLAIVHEVLGVLAKKFARDPEKLARVAVFLSDLGEMVQPGHRVRVLRDDADNRVLECAISGHAEAIVTGDHAMLRLRDYRGVRILRLGEYLDRESS